MIYYYSACGNSKWVAEKTAEETHDTAVSIVDMNFEGKSPLPVRDGETLGLIFPVYAWNAPEIVCEFVKKLNVSSKAYVYAICTCGNEAGYLFKRFQKFIRLNACFSVQMPNTYIIMFDTDGKEQEQKKITNAAERIEKICRVINAKKDAFDVTEGSFPFIKTNIEYPFFKLMVSDKKFTVDDKCVSCGLCAKGCPVQNIIITDGKPVWQGHCTHCTACINRCPQNAIQYGNGTKRRGRYRFEEK